MAQGDTDAQVVESPITAAKIKAAMDATLAATQLSGPIVMCSFNQGRSVIVASYQDEIL